VISKSSDPLATPADDSIISHRLPIRPKLLPGESLNSWICRLAELYSLSIPEFLNLAGLANRHNRKKLKDLDTHHCPSMLRKLARLTGARLTTLENATCQSALERLGDQRSEAVWLSPWLLSRPHPVGAKKSFRIDQEYVPSHGFQYCPACLSAPDSSYLRIAWRYSFVTVCEEHRCLLASSCPHCYEKVDLSFAALKKSKLRRDRLRCCSCCLQLYGRVSATEAPISPTQISYLIHQQSLHLDLLRQPNIDLVVVKDYFDFLGWLIEAFYSHSWRRDLVSLGNSFLADLAGLPPFISEKFPSEAGSLRSYPALERAKLLLMSSYMLDPWPAHFSAVRAMANDFNKRFSLKYQTSPLWLANPRRRKPPQEYSNTLANSLTGVALRLAGCRQPTTVSEPLDPSIVRTELRLRQRRRSYIRRITKEAKIRQKLMNCSGANTQLPIEDYSVGYDLDFMLFH
jgi:hypothetical protein